MALTLVSTSASERLLRHVQSLSEAEAEEVLHLLVNRREQVLLVNRGEGPRRAKSPVRRHSSDLLAPGAEEQA